MTVLTTASLFPLYAKSSLNFITNRNKLKGTIA
jgi:hypothetical protein